MKNDGGQAFPVTSPPSKLGMTLRDWFAGQALAGMNARLIHDDGWPSVDGREIMARQAYAQADAMLAQRAKQ